MQIKEQLKLINKRLDFNRLLLKIKNQKTAKEKKDIIRSKTVEFKKTACKQVL